MLILDEENRVCTEISNVVYRDVFWNVYRVETKIFLMNVLMITNLME